MKSHFHFGPVSIFDIKMNSIIDSSWTSSTQCKFVTMDGQRILPRTSYMQFHHHQSNSHIDCGSLCIAFLSMESSLQWYRLSKISRELFIVFFSDLGPWPPAKTNDFSIIAGTVDFEKKYVERYSTKVRQNEWKNKTRQNIKRESIISASQII